MDLSTLPTPGYVEALIRLAIRYRLDRLTVSSIDIVASPEPSRSFEVPDSIPQADQSRCPCGHDRATEHNPDGQCLLCPGEDCAPEP